MAIEIELTGWQGWAAFFIYTIVVLAIGILIGMNGSDSKKTPEKTQSIEFAEL